MPRRRDDRPGAIGGYWLSRRANSPTWCRTWFDRRTRQTLRASLGTDDLERAKLALARWVVEQGEPQTRDARAVTLAVVFQRYWEHHGRHVVGAGVQRRNLYLALERLAGVTVAELTADRQHALIRDLRAAGYADGTVKRIMAAVKAAVGWAWRRGDVAAAPPFVRLPDSPPRERVLTIAELAALWDAAGSDHARAFLLLLIGTAARPRAVLELTRFQCDVSRWLIDLNPPERPQTKKRLPVVPMCDTLAAWLATMPAGPLVTYQGKPIAKINATWRAMRARAGLGAEVVPYTVRHTIATEMRARGVPELEIAGFLGHAMQNFRTTGRYAKYAPNYLGRAARSGGGHYGGDGPDGCPARRYRKPRAFGLRV